MSKHAQGWWHRLTCQHVWVHVYRGQPTRYDDIEEWECLWCGKHAWYATTIPPWPTL